MMAQLKQSVLLTRASSPVPEKVLSPTFACFLMNSRQRGTILSNRPVINSLCTELTPECIVFSQDIINGLQPNTWGSI